eukprot:gene10731-10887_t
MGKLQQLRKLWANNNRLQEVPDELGQCTALQELYLDSNQLKTLPDSLTKLVNLRRLYVEGNPGLSIAPAVQAMPAMSGPVPQVAGTGVGGGSASAEHHQEFLLDPMRFVEQQDKY